MYKIDKKYLMHDNEGYAAVEEAIKSNDDIDITSVGNNITPEIANILNNYAIDTGHNIITSNNIYNEASTSIFNIKGSSSRTVYIDKDLTRKLHLQNLSKLKPNTIDCTMAQSDVVYLRCIYEVLSHPELNLCMDTEDIKICLRTLRKIFVKDTIDLSVNRYIIFDDYNITYVDDTFVNTMYSSIYNQPNKEDFMYSNNVYPAYIFGNVNPGDSYGLSKIEEIKSHIESIFKTLKYSKEKIKATELLMGDKYV